MGAPVVQKAAFTPALNAAAPKGVMAAVAGAAPAILSSTAAVATEGTNEWFGVDDLRLLAVLFVVHWAILAIWLGSYMMPVRTRTSSEKSTTLETKHRIECIFDAFEI